MDELMRMRDNGHSANQFAVGFKAAMMPESSRSTPKPADSKTRFAAVYRVLTEAISAHAFPGCAFGVLAGGSVVLQDALGRFTYEDAAPVVAPDTVYDVASITKVLATTAAA